MKTEQRKRDEAALRYAGFLGHTHFIVADGTGEFFAGKSTVTMESCDVDSCRKHAKPGERIYIKTGKRTWKLIEIAR